MLGARAVGAPYHQGRLRVGTAGDALAYEGTRWGGRASYRLVVRPGGPIRPTERDVWLTSRWRAWTRRLGLLWETPVEHEPWPLAEASVEVLEQNLTRAAGLLAPASASLVHYSQGVRHVRSGPSRPVGPAAGPK
ncbi:DUF2071 domain-containing protein [Streptomyces longwoodensis]|uniref:DUF2071 domain-containing protein n=1 Tax=Streptomyces longwoodensis TaxID=68231 RepID=UPI0033C9E7F0